MVNDIKSGKTAGGLGEIYGKVLLFLHKDPFHDRPPPPPTKVFDVGALLTAAGKGDVYNLTSILSDGICVFLHLKMFFESLNMVRHNRSQLI